MLSVLVKIFPSALKEAKWDFKISWYSMTVNQGSVPHSVFRYQGINHRSRMNLVIRGVSRKQLKSLLGAQISMRPLNRTQLLSFLPSFFATLIARDDGIALYSHQLFTVCVRNAWRFLPCRLPHTGVHTGLSCTK